MAQIIPFIPHLERKRELLQSIENLFGRANRLFGTLCRARGEEFREVHAQYMYTRTLLQIECSVAISHNFQDPMMDKVRRFYETC